MVMSRFIDLTGHVFERWTVLRFDVKANKWLCQCACESATQRLVAGMCLRDGRSKSCGCLRIEHGRRHGATINLRHGEGSNGKETPEYRAWVAMRSRCTNKNDPHFLDYGARGISVCETWMASFEAFLADVGRRPGGTRGKMPAYSLDRFPDPNGNYEPGNVRWATWEEQNAPDHQRKDRPTDAVPRRVLLLRLHHGWPEHLARSLPIRARP